MVALGGRGAVLEDITRDEPRTDGDVRWGAIMARLLALTRRGVGLAVGLGLGVGTTGGWGRIGVEVSCGSIAGVAADTVVGIDSGLDSDLGLGPALGRTALGL